MDPELQQNTPGEAGADPAFEPPPQPSEALTPEPAPSADSAMTPESATPPPSQTADWQSVREAARGLGLDLSRYPDDNQALAALVRQAASARQADYYADLGRQLVPHAGALQEFFQQRQAPQPATERPAWQPPEIDERWLSLVKRDPATGVFVPAAPGIPPEIVRAVNERADWEQRFNRDPAQFLQPLIEDRARQIADERINERFASHQRQQATEQILRTNSEWLYQRDDQGRLVRGATGQAALSPLGARYAAHIREIESYGVSDPIQVDALARRILQGEVAAARLAQQAGGAPAAQTAGATAQVNQNPLQAQPPQQRRGNPSVPPPVPSSTLSLREAMRRDLEAAGTSDDDFRMFEP